MIMQEYGFDIINLIYCSRFIAVLVVGAAANITIVTATTTKTRPLASEYIL